MNVAIIGMGFVGLSLAVVLADKKIHVYGVEIDEQKIRKLNLGKSTFFEPKLQNLLEKSINSRNLEFTNSVESVFNKSDIFFVTVGTPTKNNQIDLSGIKKSIITLANLLADSSKKPLIVIKSTIAPGTTKKIIKTSLEKKPSQIMGKDFFLVTNPEFLREGNAIKDQKDPHVIVIGAEDKKSKQLMTSFYKKIYPKRIPRIITNFPTSELIKYSNNAYLATKISFINTISNLCQQIDGANIDEVAKVIGMDPRIGSLFLKAGPGFGGSCLPKDLTSFISVYQQFGLTPKLLTSVKNVNEEQINNIYQILKKKLFTLQGKTISILGLSFKENSDDIRKSRSILLIKKLLKNKIKLKVHDPKAIPNTKKIFQNKIQYFSKISDCVNNSHCTIIMTPWKNYSNLSFKTLEKMKSPIVLDTRRILKNPPKNIDYIAYGINQNNKTK